MFFGAITKMAKLYAGEKAKISPSEIVNAMINLTDVKSKFSPEIYFKIYDQYKIISANKEKTIVTPDSFIMFGCLLIDVFDAIAPFEKYSSGCQVSLQRLIDYEYESSFPYSQDITKNNVKWYLNLIYSGFAVKNERETSEFIREQLKPVDFVDICCHSRIEPYPIAALLTVNRIFGASVARSLFGLWVQRFMDDCVIEKANYYADYAEEAVALAIYLLGENGVFTRDESKSMAKTLRGCFYSLSGIVNKLTAICDVKVSGVE